MRVVEFMAFTRACTSRTHNLGIAFDIESIQNTQVLISRYKYSAAVIATGYGLGNRGVETQVPVGSRFFSSPRRPDRVRGPTQPPIQRLHEDLSPRVKRPGREADY
jgi:hypothetical protein